MVRFPITAPRALGVRAGAGPWRFPRTRLLEQTYRGSWAASDQEYFCFTITTLAVIRVTRAISRWSISEAFTPLLRGMPRAAVHAPRNMAQMAQTNGMRMIRPFTSAAQPLRIAEIEPLRSRVAR